MTITAQDENRTEHLSPNLLFDWDGFIVDEAHFGKEEKTTVQVPYPHKNAEDILKHVQS